MSNTIDSRLIGVTIRNLRLSRNWTQDYLANKFGCCVRHLRRIETYGTTDLDAVNHFAETFEVSALDILNGCF